MNPVHTFWLILMLIAPPTWAFQSRVVNIPSAAMHRTFEATVVLPDQYARGSQAPRFPVVYVLHGSGGDYTDWTANSRIGKLADRYHVILVMPDGGHESWYIDSPVDPRSRYGTYVGTEVVAYIDSHFRTIATKQARAITGLSMGGFGALRIALDRPDAFGAAGSMSGAVDPRRSEGEPGIERVFGDPMQYADFWNRVAIVASAEDFGRDHIALTIDCGASDSLVQSNRLLHERLVELGVPHGYAERPGGHTWKYWSNAVKYQVSFFAGTFRQAARDMRDARAAA
ncbi:esterase family protein [Paraburkholderia sprentiae WSM5005]|uniref:Esterase family protein n=1 Tax=Paraburkholderia sprentiae WSM5005 TaxID=754502 RepID=A0A1I9YM52_9BURK|nr:alpha/beta hydrolase family protein [Paraburkholderia sprentiae]APA87385.1 esterase family protein [Paraburkholderia sprentiae WSM5005]